MNSLQPIDLQLRITSFDEPIRGSLTDMAGRTLPFTGWIELSSALGEISAGGSEEPIIHTTSKEAGNGQ
jgi:hypothetical protein